MIDDRRAKLTESGKREAWFRGQLYHLLRPDAQSRIYWSIHDWKHDHPEDSGPFVINAHRGLGKSFLLILLAIERALSGPNQFVRIAAPDREQCRSYARPIIRQILDQCPRELAPEKVDDVWSFKNPRWGQPGAVSELELVSCKDDAERQRGPRSDLIVVDEARNIVNLAYVLEDIFGFHFVGRERPLMVLCSTPPHSADHVYTKKYVEEAKVEGRYIEIPTFENKDWRPQDDRMLSKLVGGKKTIAWLREAHCQLQSDPERLIIPEIVEARSTVIVNTYERPQFFFPYMFMDTGWVDFTALIWAYPDWAEQLLIVEKTILVRRKNTGFIAELIRETERELYGEHGPAHGITRVGDLTPQQLDDLEIDHGVTVLPAIDRHDPDSTIATLRTRIQNHGLRIIESTSRGLIHQLENGVRDDKTGKIPRSQEMGHCDALMALAYGNRNVDYHANPDVRRPGYSVDSFYSLPMPKRTGSIQITRQPIVITRRPL